MPHYPRQPWRTMRKPPRTTATRIVTDGVGITDPVHVAVVGKWLCATVECLSDLTSGDTRQTWEQFPVSNGPFLFRTNRQQRLEMFQRG